MAEITELALPPNLSPKLRCILLQLVSILQTRTLNLRGLRLAAGRPGNGTVTHVLSYVAQAVDIKYVSTNAALSSSSATANFLTANDFETILLSATLRPTANIPVGTVLVWTPPASANLGGLLPSTVIPLAGASGLFSAASLTADGRIRLTLAQRLVAGTIYPFYLNLAGWFAAAQT